MSHPSAPSARGQSSTYTHPAIVPWGPNLCASSRRFPRFFLACHLVSCSGGCSYDHIRSFSPVGGIRRSLSLGWQRLCTDQNGWGSYPQENKPAWHKVKFAKCVLSMSSSFCSGDPDAFSLGVHIDHASHPLAPSLSRTTCAKKVSHPSQLLLCRSSPTCE